MTPIAVDYETFYSKKLRYGLVQMIPETYCANALFDPYLISVSDGTNCWSGSPKDFNWASLDGHPLLSHNARFDQVVYQEMVKRGWAPKLSIPSWRCTANLAVYICNRRSLQESVDYLFNHRVSKEYRGFTDNKRWPDDYTASEREKAIAAGKSDALWCWRLWDKFSDRWPETERRLSDMTILQGQRGVKIDRDLLKHYICVTHDMLLKTEKVIPWISGAEEDDWSDFDSKPTSTKCIAEQCRRVGIGAPPVKSKDEEGYVEWELTNAKAHPWILAVGAYRSINKLHKTFETIKERLRDDDTLPFSLKYFGGHTGRWSGDARVNLQNQRRLPMMQNSEGLMEPDDEKVKEALKETHKTGALPSWVKNVVDFRALIIPRTGKKMIVSDLLQIEPRILAWLSGNQEFLKQVAAGDSPYVAHARATMGFTGEKMDKNSDLYKLAKARILGLGYQCGWEKFIVMAQNLAGIDVTVDDPEFVEEENPYTGEIKKVSGYGFNSRRIVKEFRDQNPKITGMWSALDDAFRRSIGGDFDLKLPNGRVMRYSRVRAAIRMVVNKETGKPERRTEMQADQDGKFKSYYGGKLTENLVQAVARDVFAGHLLAIEDKGWTNLFSVHDEAVVEVDPDVSARDVEEVMSKCPEWLPGCPIAAEAKEVIHYQK